MIKVNLPEDRYDEGFASFNTILKIDDNMYMVVVNTTDKYVQTTHRPFSGPDYKGVRLEFTRFADNYHDYGVEPEDYIWEEFRKSSIVIETDFKYTHVQIVPMKYEYHVLMMNDPWERDKKELIEGVDYEEIYWYVGDE